MGVMWARISKIDLRLLIGTVVFELLHVFLLIAHDGPGLIGVATL